MASKRMKIDVSDFSTQWHRRRLKILMTPIPDEGGLFLLYEFPCRLEMCLSDQHAPFLPGQHVQQVLRVVSEMAYWQKSRRI
jgi:hypothetical protein